MKKKDDTRIDFMVKALEILRKEIDKKEAPLYWVEFLFLVAQMGEKGITTKDAAERIGMTQGIASRMVKLLSRYYDHVAAKDAGLDLLVTVPDHINRHRQRVFLSEKGKSIVEKIATI